MHTKGPWTTEVLQELTSGGERMPASYISSSQGWANSGMAGRRTVAIVGHWKDRPNPEDDARLIAAAPELLSLLEDYYEVFKDGEYFKPDDEFLKDTREAIRKAKGEVK